MNYRNPQYTEDGRIDCEIEHPEFGWIPFTADPSDIEDYSRELHGVMLASGSVAPYQPPPEPTAEELGAEVRSKRDRLLTASDWTQVADAPVDQAAWAVYRQALRDVPQQSGFPQAVEWPTEPE